MLIGDLLMKIVSFKCKLLGCTMRIYVFPCGLGSSRYHKNLSNMIYEDFMLLKTHKKQF